jgi:hypothetical protein
VSDNTTPTSRAAVAQARNPGGSGKTPRPGEGPTFAGKGPKPVSEPARKALGATHPDSVVNRSGKKPEKSAPIKPKRK